MGIHRKGMHRQVPARLAALSPSYSMPNTSLASCLRYPCGGVRDMQPACQPSTACLPACFQRPACLMQV